MGVQTTGVRQSSPFRCYARYWDYRPEADSLALATRPEFKEYIEYLAPSGFRSLIIADEAEFKLFFTEPGSMRVGEK